MISIQKLGFDSGGLEKDKDALMMDIQCKDISKALVFNIYKMRCFSTRNVVAHRLTTGSNEWRMCSLVKTKESYQHSPAKYGLFTHFKLHHSVKKSLC